MNDSIAITNLWGWARTNGWNPVGWTIDRTHTTWSEIGVFPDGASNHLTELNGELREHSALCDYFVENEMWYVSHLWTDSLQAARPPERTASIVAGPVHPPYRQQLAEALTATKTKYRVIRDDRFIQDSELPPYLAASDCVLCVYNEFSGSSNVLLQAAVFGKTALVSPGGAMEDAIRRYGFGEVASFDRQAEFIAAVRKLAALGHSERSALGARAPQNRSLTATAE